MPYTILKHVEPDAPQVIAKIYSKVPLEIDTIEVHQPHEPTSFVGAVVEHPAPQLTILPDTGTPIGGIHSGPYNTLEDIRVAVEKHTGEPCAITAGG